MWTAEHTIDTSALPEQVWRLWADVDGWPEWNGDIERIELDGSFAAGGRITMTPHGQEAIELRIAEAVEPVLFVDEAHLGDVVVRTTHRVERVGSDRSRVTYRMEIDGPAAGTLGPQLGPAISADFPETLAALVARAEGTATEVKMTQQVRSEDGTAIALETIGEGPPVVLVDGAFGSRAWGPNVGLAPLLAPQFSVHRYDRRGRGESGDGDVYEARREIEDLDCVIAATGGSAFVFGISSGGNLALRAAANGVAIRKLAIWEPTFLVGNLRPPLPGDYVERLRGFLAADRRGDAVEYFMTAAVGLPGEFVAPMREMPVWTALEAAADTLPYDGAIVAPDMTGDKPARAEWTPVAVATLVLDGATSPWLSQGADGLASALPNAQRRTLAGQQHDVDAAALAPVLIDFFQVA